MNTYMADVFLQGARLPKGMFLSAVGSLCLHTGGQNCLIYSWHNRRWFHATIDPRAPKRYLAGDEFTEAIRRLDLFQKGGPR